jgi:hypothetical protein
VNRRGALDEARLTFITADDLGHADFGCFGAKEDDACPDTQKSLNNTDGKTDSHRSSLRCVPAQVGYVLPGEYCSAAAVNRSLA